MKTVITVPLIHKVPACKIRTNLIYWRNSASTRKYVLVWNTENIIVVYFQLWKWFSTRFLWLKLLTFHWKKRKYIKNKCYAKFTYCLLSVKQHSHVNANWSFIFKYPNTHEQYSSGVLWSINELFYWTMFKLRNAMI